MLLTPELRHQLEIFAECSTPLFKRRAEVLLGYDAGLPTHEVAAQVGLSPSRTRYWRRQFQLRSTAIFRGRFENLREKESSVFRPEINTFSADIQNSPASVQVLTGDSPSYDNYISDGSTPNQLLIEKPPSPGILPKDTMAEAGRKTLLYHFAEMLLHEQGTLDGEDIEELHHMRVATRRMRAAFEVFADFFRPKAIRPFLKGLRLVGHSLGSVRDLDVFIQKISLYQSALQEKEQLEFEPLLTSWRQRRQAARINMIDHLNSPGYHDFKRKFTHFLMSPGKGAATLPYKIQVGAEVPGPHRVRDILPMHIFSCLAAVRAYDDILLSASFSQLHSLRIECKKLRYTLEFFREVLGVPTGGLIEELKVLQDHLGNLHDADVAIQLLREFLEQWEINQATLPLTDREDPQPILVYLSVQHTERHNLLTGFPQVWTHFMRPETMQNFSAAVAVL